MPTAQSAREVLDREHLAARAKLIDLAAFLDRVDRAEGAGCNDPRLDTIRRGVEILCGDASGRTEQIQLLFSLPYRQNWQKDYGL